MMTSFFRPVLTVFSLAACLVSLPVLAANPVDKNDSPSIFLSSEFDFGWQLSAVKAQYIYGKGYAGSGQVVAVFDSGLNASHADFAGRVASRSFDYVNGRWGVTDDVNGHGTFVAGLIAAAKNGYGMHGLAFEAKLLPIRVVSPDGAVRLSDASMGNAVYHALSKGARTFNNSWNSSATIFEVSRAQLDAYMPNTLQAYRTAVNVNTAVVFAAGNEGRSNPGFYASLPILYPELERGWVAVVATDRGGSIASYSNRCGASAGWCIAAPGTGVISTYRTGNAYATGSGTSFAAPIVSAAIAILKQRWPSLTVQQIRDILFRSANKTGIYANSAIYGQGFLDLESASRPIGEIYTVSPAGRRSGGSSTSGTGTVFGRGLRAVSAGDLPHMIVLDEFGRDFEADTTAFFSHAGTSFDSTAALNGFGEGMERFEEGHASYAYSFTTDSKTSLTDAPLDGLRLFIEAPLATQTHITSSFNVDPSASFGLAAREDMFSGMAVDDEALLNPYMSLAKNPVTLTAKTMLNDTLWVKGGFFMGEQATDPNAPQTLTSDPNFIRTRGQVFGAAAETGVKLGKASGLAFTAGVTQEDGAFLGSTSSGATALADTSTTAFVSASARFALGDGLSAFGGLDVGFTDVAAATNSMVKSINGVTSQSFRAGLVKNRVFNGADKFGFVVSGPLRVGSGAAHLDVPVAMNSDGSVTTQAASLALGARSQEVDVQAFYVTEVGQDSTFSAGLMLRENAGHVEGARDAVALARYKLSF